MTLPTEDVAALVARLRDGLEGVPPGPWAYSPWHEEEGPAAVRVPDGWVLCATAADSHAAHIALCSPDNIRALLDHIAAQDAALSTLAGERDEARRLVNQLSEDITFLRKRRGDLVRDKDAAEARATTAEAQVVAMRAANSRLALDYNEVRAKVDQIDASLAFIEHEARNSRYGVTIEWVVGAEGEAYGFRFGRQRYIGPPLKTAREAIERARYDLNRTALLAGTPPSGAETQEKVDG